MLRISNQGILQKGSIQVTDEYLCSEIFPNSYKAKNYLEWCELECKRMPNCFIVKSFKEVEFDGVKTKAEVCHIRRRTDG
tara:strand:+ start:465 stop:704 length:240 start_codon:yes stop_codon:yes gene_type:complete